MSVTRDLGSVIIFRRTHTLIYDYNKCDASALKRLLQTLTVTERAPTGAVFPVFNGYLYDTDPEGRDVLRIPPYVSDEVLHSVWPAHKMGESAKAWRSRKVDVKFDETFAYRSVHQSDICAYLTGTGTHSHLINGMPRMVVAGTAVGKSYCTIRAWAHRGDVLMAMFAQNSHLMNFKEEILKFTDTMESEILVIGEKTNLAKVTKNLSEIGKYKVILCIHRTATNSIQNVLDNNSVSAPSDFANMVLAAGVGTFVIDEAHLEYQSVVLLGLLLNVDQTIYLTATPKRTDWMEDRVLASMLPHDDAIVIAVENRLVATQVSYSTHASAVDVKMSTNARGYFDVPFYFDYLMREDKWVFIEEILTHIITKNSQTEGAGSIGIVVSGKLEFLDHVIERMKEIFPDRSVGNFSSRVKAGPTRMAELEKDIVVTTEKSFGGSVNPERMSHMVFLAAIASPVWIEQVAGRLRGLNGLPCEFIDLCDTSFPSVLEHSKRRFTTLRKLSVGKKVRTVAFSEYLKE